MSLSLFLPPTRRHLSALLPRQPQDTISRSVRVPLPPPAPTPSTYNASVSFSCGGPFRNLRLPASPASNASANRRLRPEVSLDLDTFTTLNRRRNVVTMAAIKASADPSIRPASPAPLAQDFARQTVQKQQRSNFHSTSISSGISHTMVSQSVNKTALHPTGVQYVALFLTIQLFRKKDHLLTIDNQAGQGAHRDRRGAPRQGTH
jgi:hypothetical protein